MNFDKEYYEKEHERLDEDDDIDEDTAFKIYKRQRPAATIHDVYLSDSVQHGSVFYFDLYRFLHTACKGDTVNIHIANFGGSCHTGFRLAHAIADCSAKTKVIVEGPCYSMGAILSLTAESLTMLPGTFLMFHNYSGGSYGKGGEMAMSIEEYRRSFTTNLDYFCGPFLTKKELNRLHKDQDVYVHADDGDINKRIVRHF